MSETLLGSGASADVPSERKLGNLQALVPKPYRNLQGGLAGLISQLIGGQSAPSLAGIPGYEGQTTAPVSGNENDLLAALMGTTSANAGTTNRDSLLAGILGGDYLSVDRNPNLAGAIEAAIRPVRSEFQNVVTPTLRAKFTMAGQQIQGDGSSPFDRASALAGQSYLDKIGDISKQIASDQYQQERQLQTQAITQQTQANTAQVNDLVTNLQAQALPRMVEQYGLDKGIELFNQRVQALLSILGVGGQLSTSQIGQGGPVQTGGRSGILGDLLLGGGGIAKAFA